MKEFLDFIRDLIDAGKERLKNPILTYYLILLIFNNWKAISIFILSKQTIETRIKKISWLYNDWTIWDFIWQSICVLFLAVIINTILPFVNWFVDYLNLNPNIERKILLYKSNHIDRDEELNKTKHEFNKNKIISGNLEAEDYNNRIKSLQNTIEDNRKLHQQEIDLIIKTNEEQLKSITENLRIAEDNLLKNSIRKPNYTDKKNSDFFRLNEILDFYNRLTNIEKKEFNFILKSLNSTRTDGKEFNDIYIEEYLNIINFLEFHNVIKHIEVDNNKKIYSITDFGKQVFKIISPLLD